MYWQKYHNTPTCISLKLYTQKVSIKIMLQKSCNFQAIHKKKATKPQTKKAIVGTYSYC